MPSKYVDVEHTALAATAAAALVILKEFFLPVSSIWQIQTHVVGTIQLRSFTLDDRPINQKQHSTAIN